MRNDSRDDSPIPCPVCGVSFIAQGRGVFCSPACRKRAHRLRQHQTHQTQSLSDLTRQLRRARELVATTIYECSSCSERFLGQRRCDCNLMARKLGLGGHCPGCDDLITIDELLGRSLEPN
jgi:hypothetical protein